MHILVGSNLDGAMAQLVSHVWKGPPSSITRLPKVCRLCRVRHNRHTFATWLRQRGTELDVIASQLRHRNLRMTKRYARIASVQVRDAVSGPDSVLSSTQEGEKVLVSHPIVTEVLALPEAKPVTH